MREIHFGRPMVGDEEKNAVMDVLNGPTLVHGPVTKDFEKDFAAYTGANHAISVSSCTAALHLIYFYLGIGPGDEVIVPAETHVATAHAVELCGAKPVFVDAEMETGNIDISLIRENITDRTKAVSLVHFLGMPVDMDGIMEISKEKDLFVVEDCALAIGSYYKGVHAGLLGDAGCFSFYPVKHMTTIEGGMLTTRHEDVALKIERQKAFGVDRHVEERKIAGLYDVTMLGFNYRMNEVEAAIGKEQLKKIEGFLTKRRENWQILYEGLEGTEGIKVFKDSDDTFKSSCYCFSVILDEVLAKKRETIINSLKACGIGTSIYYPSPVPHLSYYKNKYGYTENTFPVAAEISGSSIALSVGPHLGKEDMEYIIANLKNIIQEEM